MGLWSQSSVRMAEHFQFASSTLTKKAKSMFSKVLNDFNKLVVYLSWFVQGGVPRYWHEPHMQWGTCEKYITQSGPKPPDSWVTPQTKSFFFALLLSTVHLVIYCVPFSYFGIYFSYFACIPLNCLYVSCLLFIPAVYYLYFILAQWQ